MPGFCIFNSVAIAALHALGTRPDVRRVAIVDIDVHHGNGTQDVLAQLSAADFARLAAQSAGEEAPAGGEGGSGSGSARGASGPAAGHGGWASGSGGVRKDVFFASLHLFDSGGPPHPAEPDADEYRFYPGSGGAGAAGAEGCAEGSYNDAAADLLGNALNVPLTPLWRYAGARRQADAQPRERARQPPARAQQPAGAEEAGRGGGGVPAAVSIGGGGEDGTPKSAETKASGAAPFPAAACAAAPAQQPDGADGGNRAGSAGASAHRGGRPRLGPTEPLPLPCGRLQYRQAFASRVLPALRACGPDLILLSAGFDGGKRDVGNSRLLCGERYCQGLDLEPSDFSWLTEQLLAVANQTCGGRLVSVLEGGYGHYETEAGVLGISPSSLADNVVAHVRALVGRPVQQAAPSNHGREPKQQAGHHSRS